MEKREVRSSRREAPEMGLARQPRLVYSGLFIVLK